MGTQITPPTPIAPTPGVSSSANAYQALFNAAYYASKPPAFQPLYQGRPGSANVAAYPLGQNETWTLIAQLIAQGWVIDEEIDAESMDPYSVMFMRELYGNTWEPAGLGAVAAMTEPPSLYTGPVPPGAIKVSTQLEDYPPYPVSAVSATVLPPTPKIANPVGARIIPQVPSQPNFTGDIFRCASANDGYAVGDSWTGASGAFNGTWTKQSLEMGMMIAWTKTA